VVAGSGVRCSAVSLSGLPQHASGLPSLASGLPRHARDLQLGSLVGLDFTPDGSLVLAEKLTAKQFRLLRIHSSGSVDVIHAGNSMSGGNQSSKTSTPAMVDIASLAVSPGGDVFLADNAQLKIFRLDISLPGGQNGPKNVTTVMDRPSGQSYQFNGEGLHVATRSLATGQLAYTFHYAATAAKGEMPTLARIEDPLGNQVSVMRDAVSNKVEAIQNTLGSSFPVRLNKQGSATNDSITRGDC